MQKAGFVHSGSNIHTMKSGHPSNAFRFHDQIHSQDTRTNFNDSHSSDAKARIRMAQGITRYAPHQGKGRQTKPGMNRRHKVIASGTDTT